MAADATLLDVFVGEAAAYLDLLGDEGAGPDEEREALRSLEQATALLEGDELGGRAAELCRRLRAGDGREELAELVGDLRRRLEETRTGASRAGRADSSLPARAQDEAESAFGDDAFNTSEHEILRSFFRDEAHEALEEVTRALLSAGPEDPDEELLDGVMRRTHSLKGSAGTVGLSAFADAAHQLEDRFEHVRSGRLPWSQQVVDRLVEAIDALRAHVDALDAPETAGDLAARARERIAAVAHVPNGTPSRDAPAGGRQVPAPKPEASSDRAVGPQLEPQGSTTLVPGAGPPVEERREAERREGDITVLRVDPGRIDRLMDSVGELVFDRTRIERRVRELRNLSRDLGRSRQELRAEISRLAGESELAGRLAELEAALARQASLLSRATGDLLEDTEALRETTTSLQDGLTSVRMQTVRTLYQRLAPQLRSIARGAGKRVKLFTAGGETEFDKTVAEQITDPLVQLLRNAVAHGIETSERRLELGKPEHGRVTLAARHEGPQVVLEVSDDGAGLDPDALRQRLVESGRWARARAELATDEDVLRSIFDAGVSSREEADQLAGRGFGLDMVRETIARLGGEMQVASTPGRGTTFTMRLPLTTAVSNALLFKVGGHVYAVPNVHVVETAHVEASSPAIPTHLRVREEPVPLVVLHAVLDLEIPKDARRVPAVVIEYAGRRLAITCDKIVGPREIVVKSLGPLLAPLPLYAGGTISGSGKVQLILDPASLVRIAHAGAEPSASAAPEPPGSRAGADGAAGRVLVADDSRAVREAMSRMLERAGYVVDVADDGSAAWRMLRELAYDVLVTDLEMPELGGLELIERVRSDEKLGRLPVIVISSKDSRDHRDRAGELGVEHFLAKPVSRSGLVKALEEVRSPRG